MNKQILQQQVNDIRAKLADMEEQLTKPDNRFKFKYKNYATCLVGMYNYYGNHTGEDTDYIKHGRYRTSEAAAQQSLKRNREANIIEAMAEQIDPNWVANWSNHRQVKCFLQKTVSGKYSVYNRYTKQAIGVPYMSQSTAEEVCRILNEKEYVI